VLDLENFVGAVLDDMGDGVTVGGAEQKGLQDEQIERALQEIGLEWRRAALWHGLVSQDHRPKYQKMIYGNEYADRGDLASKM
jgi:hypothetical protein